MTNFICGYPLVRVCFPSLVSPSIQKDIVKVAACETIKVIIDDLNNDLLFILIDESQNVSVKEKMVVVLRYVDKK